MVVSKIGVDLEVFNNVQPPDLNISNSTSGFLLQVPQKANEITKGYLGYSVLGTLFIIIFVALSDKTQFSNFGYDNLRAIALAFNICSIVGLVLININFITNYVVVATCIIFFMIAMLMIIWTESSQ